MGNKEVGGKRREREEGENNEMKKTKAEAPMTTQEERSIRQELPSTKAKGKVNTQEKLCQRKEEVPAGFLSLLARLMGRRRVVAPSAAAGQPPMDLERLALRVSQLGGSAAVDANNLWGDVAASVCGAKVRSLWFADGRSGADNKRGKGSGGAMGGFLYSEWDGACEGFQGKLRANWERIDEPRIRDSAEGDGKQREGRDRQGSGGTNGTT